MVLTHPLRPKCNRNNAGIFRQTSKTAGKKRSKTSIKERTLIKFLKKVLKEL